MHKKFKELRIIVALLCLGQTFGLIGEGGKNALIGTNGKNTLIGEGGKNGLIGEAGRIFQEFTVKLKSWASAAGLAKK